MREGERRALERLWGLTEPPPPSRAPRPPEQAASNRCAGDVIANRCVFARTKMCFALNGKIIPMGDLALVSYKDLKISEIIKNNNKYYIKDYDYKT